MCVGVVVAVALALDGQDDVVRFCKSAAWLVHGRLIPVSSAKDSFLTYLGRGRLLPFNKNELPTYGHTEKDVAIRPSTALRKSAKLATAARNISG